MRRSCSGGKTPNVRNPCRDHLRGRAESHPLAYDRNLISFRSFMDAQQSHRISAPRKIRGAFSRVASVSGMHLTEGLGR